MRLFRAASVALALVASIALAVACGSSETPAPGPATGDGGAGGGLEGGGARGVEPAGQSCTAADQCYGGVDGGADGGAITGQVTCITKVPNGYCTHTCAADTECCAAPGECLTGVKQVCSPFENQGAEYCFLSCEDDDIARAVAASVDAGYAYDAGGADAGLTADTYCENFAGTETSCRSSGGGSKNRKVCIPK